MFEIFGENDFGYGDRQSDLEAITEYIKAYMQKNQDIGKTNTLSLHVFTDEQDAFLPVTALPEAIAEYYQYIADKGCARLYFDHSDETGVEVWEDCLLSFGEFPM
ncbi:MAG: hypothetical protein KQI81_08745 [Deltaproteobacteria bacterium]|nr:hypothetical protein [Deltaproteobacteria bacterium]